MAGEPSAGFGYGTVLTRLYTSAHEYNIHLYSQTRGSRLTTKIIPKSRKTRKGRPSVVESIELDEHIRESAIESFLESGYEAATMARIAKNAGIARQTLYSRYKNKESLFEQVLASAFFQWHEENLDISLEDDVPLESQLIRMANIILDRDLDPRVVKLGRVAIYNIGLLQRLLSQK